ncbi:MarR family winged helix-turn-helix transcriptional regulator [Bacillus suaedae]|uniref:MarR family transcriptional regulator n=1 Tax=Halalkalibacter suaedae TaxID=2822140 RepID=A0A940WXY1_9BACI|nr:MarR family transcriptional regulator [Bacillus suaedae]MBP3950445.1 MarR family transcriptional regulator [Bacillus suaedae]
MREEQVRELIDRYIAVTFSVTRKADSLVKAEIGSDLTNDQQYTLRYINRVKECTSSELADIFDVKKSAITANINRLWKKGLIKRTRDEQDRRVVYLTLTDEGQRLFLQTEERVQALVGSIINQLDIKEIESFIETYEKLNQVLDNVNGGVKSEFYY